RPPPPAWEESLWVRALPSLQAVPLAFGEGPQRSVFSLQPPMLQAFPAAEQSRGEPPQTPAVQTSLTVQNSPSSHAEPSALSGLEQMPLAGSQVPATWHWSSAVQTTGLAPTQVPAWQGSVWVRGVPALQAAALALSGLEQMPLSGSQVPATWHWSSAVQTTGLVPTQVPAWQVSVWVQASPSLQAAPLALTGLEQVPLAGLQTPASWHWSEAVQATGFVPVQTPASHTSVWVQALPSVQAVPFGFDRLEQVPVAGSQTPAS